MLICFNCLVAIGAVMMVVMATLLLSDDVMQRGC